MFTLKVLGGAALEGPGGPIEGRPAQKRRLALLALLALHPANRLSRDKLIAYLWPDRDEESARHLLSDALYVINRALGAEALSTPGDEVRLNTEHVACDARRFEAAASVDPESAVRLYAGPFLDGFILEGSEEFEAWVGRERERLSRRFAVVLEQVARRREEAGDHHGAIEAWQRLSVEDPYNSRVAIELTRALRASGDPAGALQTARAHAAFLKSELGLQAPAELRDLMAALQTPSPEVETPAAPPPAIEPPSAPVMTPPPPSHAPATLPRSGFRRAVILLTVAVIALAAAILAWRTPAAPGGASEELRSIAVMPFDFVGPEPAGRYFGEGIADELTTSLGRAAKLKVAARTSAFAFKGRQMDAREIGRALGVDALVEGSVQQTGDTVRVAVRLVNTRDGYQLWSNTWHNRLSEMPALQQQITAGLLEALERRPPEPLAATASLSSEAYDLYLQGRYLWHQRTRDSLKQAVEKFERATRLAPGYAPAFSGLADAYAVMGFYDYLRPAEAFPAAKAAAERALALDPTLPQAHASLGYVALYYEWNWSASEASFQRAIALNPSYSTGHQWYGNYLTARGRFDEAIAAMRRAQALDPLSMIASAALGWTQFFSRDYEAAAAQCGRTLALNPRFELAHLWAGWANEALGRYDAAIEHLGAAVTLSSNSAIALASLGRAQALAGDTSAARETLATLHREHAEYLPAYEIAKLHLALGERDEAIAWLRRARDDRSHSMVFLAVDPQLDALRQDPRFVELQAFAQTNP